MKANGSSLGIVALGLWVLFNFQGGMQNLDYLTLVFLTGPCISMHITFQNYYSKKWFITLATFAAVCLVLSYSLEVTSVPSILCAIPWIVLSIVFIYNSSKEWLSLRTLDHALLKVLAGIFWLVGASWMMADRIGFQPLDFDPTIVRLTAIHFHFAGFMLCSISYFILKNYSLTMQRIVLLGLIIGIPAVAAGITLSNIYGPSLIELIGATFMASTGILIAVLILKYYKQPVIAPVIAPVIVRSRNAQYLGIISALCLLLGMCFSLLYAWRNILHVKFISIPWMWAVHGSLNALGFALLGTLALKINSCHD